MNEVEKYKQVLNEIEKELKKQYSRLAWRNCFEVYPQECKRCLWSGLCLQQKVLNIINLTKGCE